MRLELPPGPPLSYALFAHCFTCSKDIFAAARIAADRVSTSEAKAGVWAGLKMAIFDWKMVLLVALNIGISAAYGFSNFFPSIVRGFGYSNVVSLLLTCLWARSRHTVSEWACEGKPRGPVM